MIATDDLGQPPATRPLQAQPRPRALAGAPGLALAAAAAAGALAGGAYFGVQTAHTSDSWARIGALVFGFLLGVAVAAVVYVAALVVAARRLFPAGRRAWPVLLTLLGHATVAGYGAGLFAALRLTPDGRAAVIALLTLAAVACGPVAFLGCGTAVRRSRPAVTVVMAIALTAGVVAGISHTVGQVREARVVAGLPLVLFDGDTADPAFAGWRRDPFAETSLRPADSFTYRGHEGYLKYFTPTGVTFVTMHTDAGGCVAPVTGYACAVAGNLPAGQLRAYTRSESYGDYPRSARFLVLVFPDGSAVSVNVSAGPTEPADITEEQARTVLGALERVDRARFEDRTGSRVTLR